MEYGREIVAAIILVAVAILFLIGAVKYRDK